MDNNAIEDCLILLKDCNHNDRDIQKTLIPGIQKK